MEGEIGMKTKTMKHFTTMAAVLAVTLTLGTGAARAADNGTITDGTLIWLKNANCPDLGGRQNWSSASNAAAALKDGMCGLRDGSQAGQWRLPTKEDLVGRYQSGTSGFTGVQFDGYWSSSRYAADAAYAWYVSMSNGYVYGYPKSNYGYVWPVRTGM